MATIVEILLAFIGTSATIISLLWAFKNKQKKQLICEKTLAVPLINSSYTPSSKTQLLFNGKNVDDPSIFSFKITNTGNQNITEKEFSGNVIISFGEATIIEVTKLNTFPSELPIKYECNSHNIILSPLLLNSKEWFSFRVLLSKFNDKMDVFTRIEGISEIPVVSDDDNAIEQLKNSVRFPTKVLIIFAIPLILISIFAGLQTSINVYNPVIHTHLSDVLNYIVTSAVLTESVIMFAFFPVIIAATKVLGFRKANSKLNKLLNYFF